VRLIIYDYLLPSSLDAFAATLKVPPLLATHSLLRHEYWDILFNSVKLEAYRADTDC
jgi:hypothetical protein